MGKKSQLKKDFIMSTILLFMIAVILLPFLVISLLQLVTLTSLLIGFIFTLLRTNAGIAIMLIAGLYIMFYVIALFAK